MPIQSPSGLVQCPTPTPPQLEKALAPSLV